MKYAEILVLIVFVFFIITFLLYMKIKDLEIRINSLEKCLDIVTDHQSELRLALSELAIRSIPQNSVRKVPPPIVPPPSPIAKKFYWDK